MDCTKIIKIIQKKNHALNHTPKKSQLNGVLFMITFRSSPQNAAIAPPIECPVTMMGMSP